MRRALVVLGVFATLVLLAGWGVHSVLSGASAEGQARTATKAASKQVAAALGRSRYPTHEAVELARLAASAPGGEPRVEVLTATGDRYDGTAELLVRITTTGTYTEFLGPGDPVTDTGCFLVVQAGRSDFVAIGHGCPAGARPLVIPPAPTATARSDPP